MNKVVQLCYRSIIQHIAGDIEKARRYKETALDEYEKQGSIISIGEIISEDVQEKLYKLFV